MQDRLQPYNPYKISKLERKEILLSELSRLTKKHMESCQLYASMLQTLRKSDCSFNAIEDVPFLPVRVFKHLDLLSIEKADIQRVIRSSGTTGLEASRIYIDKKTALSQTHALVKILQDFLGLDRLPMLIVDHPSVLKSSNSFTARGAGIRGLSNFGRDHTYALSDDGMELDLQSVEAFSKRHEGKPKLLFGFTFMVWKYFIQALAKQDKRVDLSNSFLFHSGGWKKLQSEAVGNKEFKETVAHFTGIDRVHNFYGMAEQVGSVFVECEHGRLHIPWFADILVRNPIDWKLKNNGEFGLVQVISILPESYPGHSLLTEDIGRIDSEDTCKCGRLGKTIEVIGRIKQAENRGCSDTHGE